MYHQRPSSPPPKKKRGLRLTRSQIELLFFQRWRRNVAAAKLFGGALRGGQDENDERVSTMVLRLALVAWRDETRRQRHVHEPEQQETVTAVVPYAVHLAIGSHSQRPQLEDVPTYAYATHSFVNHVRIRPTPPRTPMTTPGPKQRQIIERHVDGGSVTSERRNDVEVALASKPPTLPPILMPQRLWLQEVHADKSGRILDRFRRDDAHGVRLLLFQPPQDDGLRGVSRQSTRSLRSRARTPASSEAPSAVWTTTTSNPPESEVHLPRPMLVPWSN